METASRASPFVARDLITVAEDVQGLELLSVVSSTYGPSLGAKPPSSPELGSPTHFSYASSSSPSTDGSVRSLSEVPDEPVSKRDATPAPTRPRANLVKSSSSTSEYEAFRAAHLTNAQVFWAHSYLTTCDDADIRKLLAIDPTCPFGSPSTPRSALLCHAHEHLHRHPEILHRIQNHFASIYPPHLMPHGPGKKRSPIQLAHLERAFQHQENPSAAQKQRLGELLGLSKKQIMAWFSSRRGKKRVEEARARLISKRAGVHSP